MEKLTFIGKIWLPVKTRLFLLEKFEFCQFKIRQNFPFDTGHTQGPKQLKLTALGILLDLFLNIGRRTIIGSILFQIQILARF